MPTTPSGTAYTVAERTGAGGNMRWYVADDIRGDLDVPLLLFAHGNGGSYVSLDTTASGEVRDWLVDNGWAVFEADAGGSSNFGNDAAQAAYVEGLAWVESEIDVGVIAALGVSMGGVIAYWLASLAPFAARVNHLVIQQGVSDLTYRYTATTSGTQVLGYAYGLGWSTVVDLPAWEAATVGHEPMDTDPSAWVGKTVLQLWDDADATVAWGNHGQAWVTKYGSAATVVVVGTSGFGHTFHSGHRTPTYTFLAALLPPEQPVVDPPPRDDVVWVVQQHRIVGDDLRIYALTGVGPSA